MKPFARLAAALALALLVPACHDETTFTTNVVPPGTVPGAPTFTLPATATGTTGFDELAAGFDVGTNGEPRLVFLRANQLLFTRRDADGSWTTPIDISLDDASAKSAFHVFVTSNNFTHVLWLDAAGVHYVRLNNSNPPTIDATGIEATISLAVPTNVTAGAAMGAVSELTVAIDRSRNHIYALWIQSIDDDGGGAGASDQVPVAAALLSGTAAFAELVALVDPNTDAMSATSTEPMLRISGAGTVHAAWSGTDATAATAAAFRHSARTAAAAWSGGANGDVISDSGGAPMAGSLNLVLARDGDAYAMYLDSVTMGDIRAAYRPVGDTNTFGIDGLVQASGFPEVRDRLIAVLEPGTERLHAVWRDENVGTFNVRAKNHSAANLGGTWSVTADTVYGPVVPTASTFLEAWADSTNRVVVVYQAPASTDDVNHTLLRIRPSGTASVFAAEEDLTSAFGLPCAELTVAHNSSGGTLLAWRQGDVAAPPLAEIFGSTYTSGGKFTPAANVSASAGVISHGPLFLRYMDTGEGHVFWHESTTAADEHDVFYSNKP
jgi:hypothetical protein